MIVSILAFLAYLLTLLFIIMSWVGLYNPFLLRDKKTGVIPSRKLAFFGYQLLAIILWVIGVILTPEHKISTLSLLPMMGVLLLILNISITPFLVLIFGIPRLIQERKLQAQLQKNTSKQIIRRTANKPENLTTSQQQPDTDKIIQKLKQEQQIQEKIMQEQLQSKEEAIQEHLRKIGQLEEQLKQAQAPIQTVQQPTYEPKKTTSPPPAATTSTPSRGRGRPRTRPKRGAIVVFDYTNLEGESSRRTVRVSSIDSTYLNGCDLDKNASRTFRRDRIHNREVVDDDTGEIFYL